jgi:thymidylate synthase
MNFIHTHYDQLYKDVLLRPIMELGITYDTVKFDHIDHVIAHPNNGYVNYTFDPKDNFPILSLREINLKAPLAEMLWYLRSDKDLNWLGKHTKIWNAFTDDEGQASSSYGHRWKNHFGRDQVQGVIDILSKEPGSRQAVIITWDPSSDGLDSERQKNVPCIPMVQFTIFNNQLNLCLTWRSQDVYLGQPFDIIGFALLQILMADKLGTDIGYIHYTINHAHLYQNQLENSKILLETSTPPHRPIKFDITKYNSKIPLIDLIRSGSDEELDQILEFLLSELKPQYNPIQKLKPIKIVV